MKTPTEFVEEWMETICSNNVENIVSLYKEDAVLLGTLDKKVRKGLDKIKEYFDFFVQGEKLRGSTNRCCLYIKLIHQTHKYRSY